MKTTTKLNRKQLTKSVLDIIEQENNTNINPSNINKFLNELNVLEINDDLAKSFSQQLRDKAKSISEQEKPTKIEISKRKKEIESQFVDSMVISVAAENTETVEEIIDHISKQDVIQLGKKINNKCYYEFIVSNNILLNQEHRPYVLISSIKVTFEIIHDFINSLNKNSKKEFSGKHCNAVMLDNIYTNMSECNNLLKKQKELLYNLAREASFSPLIKKLTLPYFKNSNSEVFIEIVESSSPIDTLNELYEKGINKFVEKIQYLKDIQERFDLNINMDDEYSSMTEKLISELNLEKEKNKALILVYLNSYESQQIIKNWDSINKALSDVSCFRIFKLTQSSHDCEEFHDDLENHWKPILSANNIHYIKDKNEKTGKTIFRFFTNKETDINDILEHPELKKYKGFVNETNHSKV